MTQETFRWNIVEVRDIVRSHSARTIDNTLIDAQTAQAICVVWDALSADSQTRMASMPIAQAGSIAWRLVA